MSEAPILQVYQVYLYLVHGSSFKDIIDHFRLPIVHEIISK